MSPAAAMRVRVTVTDAWDTVAIDTPPATTVRELKERALRAATGRRLDPDAYLVKYRGALVLDETQTLATLEVPDGAPLIVLPARRQPVR